MFVLVRLNRYVIQIILFHGFDVCISTVRLNRYVIQIILFHGVDVCISTVRLNRYVINPSLALTTDKTYLLT